MDKVSIEAGAGVTDTEDAENAQKASQNTEPEKILRPHPVLDTQEVNFGANCLAYIKELITEHNRTDHENHMNEDNQTAIEFSFESIYDFILNASPEVLKLLLESVANPRKLPKLYIDLELSLG